jgi:putative flippase GtrA
MQKIKRLLGDRKEMMELVRYVIAGGLTTLLSLIVAYGCYILLSEEHTINGADATQLFIGNVVSWIVAVLFAFWINRRIVFRVQGGTRSSKLREFFSFVGARAASLLLFEIGLAEALKWMGVSNFWNRLIVLVLVMVFNYVVSKFWIFKGNEAPGTAVDGAPGGTSRGRPYARRANGHCGEGRR